jgi:hypothetical protein
MVTSHTIREVDGGWQHMPGSETDKRTIGYFVAVEVPAGTPVEDVTKDMEVVKDHPVFNIEVECMGDIDVYPEAQ